jgi:hypothetical protein
MITFHCPHCGVRVKVHDEFASRQGRCLRCRKHVTVPSALDAAQLVPLSAAKALMAPSTSGPSKAGAPEHANGNGQPHGSATAMATRVDSAGIIHVPGRQLPLAAPRQGLESCPDCLTFVSRRAVVCPRCGSPLQQRCGGDGQIAPRFRSLKLLARVYRAAAWLLLALAVLCGTIAGLLVVAAVTQQQPISEAYGSLTLTIASMLASLACYATAERLLVFMSIEENTRATRRALTREQSA